jgi:hypothetical protein
MNIGDEEMIKEISKSSKIVNLNDLPSALTLHIIIILTFEIFDVGNRFGGYCKMIQKVLDEDKDNFVQKIKQSKTFRFSLSIKGLFVVEGLNIDGKRYNTFLKNRRQEKL